VRIGKEAVSRIVSRLEEQQKEWRERPLEEKSYPYLYLYLDATYLKVRWGARVTSMALVACLGVDEEGFREVLAVEEVAGTEKGAAYASLLRGLLDRGLSGVRLVVSDDHEGIKAAVFGELPGAQWQRCAVHFERSVLSHVPSSFSVAEVAEDLKAIFKGKAPEDREGFGRGVCLALQEELPEGRIGLRGGDRGRTHLVLQRHFALPGSAAPVLGILRRGSIIFATH